MLFPIENEIRQVKYLNGIWRFRKEGRLGQGFDEKWYDRPLQDWIDMPVPASYNDITVDKSLRDHVGWVWYEREVAIPRDWQNKRMVLRFGSVTHHAVVYMNGKEIARHKGGFLPFEVEVAPYVTVGSNRLTVAVSNMLDESCLPYGVLKDADPAYFPAGEKQLRYEFDFFNFAGIHRPVRLYTTPDAYIKDITVKTDICGAEGIVDYRVVVEGETEDCEITLLDADGELVAKAKGAAGKLRVPNAKLWEVRAAYLYQLDIRAGEDHYTLPIGIRTVTTTATQLLVNGKPVYLKGFGKHEDFFVKGKGLDEALNAHDYELLKWINANSFRTSHYPYSEEMMQMADRQGFLVIDEVPAVGMNYWKPEPVFTEGKVDAKTLAHHKDTLTELYERDKNHPCVIIWSLSNEMQTQDPGALAYHEEIVNHMRALDDTRPLMNVTDNVSERDTVGQLYDLVGLNRYYSWYFDRSNLASIYPRLTREFRIWHEKTGKPIMMTEYGADTIAGNHKLPETIFSEEYQVEYYKENNRALDDCEFVCGEHPWCFADFATAEGLKRFDGNKKGLFTRDRQPKSAAFIFRERWSKK
ncbi:MAG: beta-glucuronidase [Oscillospiraceae bacterium]|nr:beta-glucuronidase [Oscillospiraceae bacterium]